MLGKERVEQGSSKIMAFAFFAMVMGVVVFAGGCGRGDEGAVPGSAESFKDPEFQKALDELGGRQMELMRTRGEINAQLVRMPTGTPERVSLEKRREEINTVLEENRRRVTELVHERMTGRKPVKRGFSK